MKTDELKKGDRVLLRNGWYATIVDNKKGNTREAVVEGRFTERGSFFRHILYAHDIMYFVNPNDTSNEIPIEHTDKQLKCKEINESIFGE